MKIGFYTENNFEGYVPKNQSGRTDTSWMAVLSAYHCPFSNMSNSPNFDVGIIIVPKKNSGLAFKGYEHYKHKCLKWAVMQEANQTYWQNYTIENQINYLNLLNQVDHIFVHNEIDVKYFKGLIPDKKVSILPSLMIDDAIPLAADKVDQNTRSGVMIGGNFCEWYSGIDSFIIAQEFEEPIYIPSMGRKADGEENIEGLNHLPYMNWSQWMIELSKVKYAVHLMRTYAAGTFSLNCARLKIPCIGYDQLDTQINLFPELSVKEGDLVEARRIAKHLKENQLFYNHVSEYAFKKYNEIYSEKIFIEKFNQTIKGVL